MKAPYFKSTLLLAFLLASGISLKAQTLREEDSKEYSATSSTELSIDNQFGNINVTDWDQNKVMITYIIEVTHSDEAKAKKLMDKIKVEFKEDGNRIVVKTKFDNGNLNTHNNKGDKQSFKIEYWVKCPKNIKLSLDNQFGDLIIGSLTGSFSADLQFGSLNAVSLTGPDTKIDSQFGKVTIGTLKNATIDIQHCELLKIDESGALSLDAQFTEIELGNVESLKADLSSCEVSVENLTSLLKMEVNMGNVKIDHIAAEFKEINIEQNMGDVTIGMDPKAGYQLKAEVNMGSIKVPDGVKMNKNKESDIPGITAEKVSATVGNGNSKVTINANMGSVRIR